MNSTQYTPTAIHTTNRPCILLALHTGDHVSVQSLPRLKLACLDPLRPEREKQHLCADLLRDSVVRVSEVLGRELILVYELVTLILSASCFWRLAAFLSCHSFSVVIAEANKRTGRDYLVCRPANMEYLAGEQLCT